MDELDTLIDQLSWNQSEEIQTAAYQELKNRITDEELPRLLQPFNSKGHWGYAALLIRDLGFPRVKSIMPGLFLWLQDTNWPGSHIILDFLASIERPLVMPFVHEARKQIYKDRDPDWLFGLQALLQVMVKVDRNRPIYALIDKINKHNPLEEQKAAMAELKATIKDEELPLLLQPFRSGEHWENSALLIQELGYPRVKNILPELLNWLQSDMWEGYRVIMDFLLTIEKPILKPLISTAIETTNRIWQGGLIDLIHKGGFDLLGAET